MELPNAVKKAAEKSEVMQKELKKGKTQYLQQGTPPQQNPQEDRDTLPKTQTELNQKPDAKPKDDEETYKKRYLTLQGMYDAQIPRLQQEIQDLKNSMSDLQEKNTQLKEAEKNLNEKNSTENAELDPEVFKEYGDEFGSLVETIQQMKIENTSLKDQVQQLTGDMSQNKEIQEKQVRNSYDTYIDSVKRELAKRSVDFEVLNTDHKFLNYLRQYPEGENESRHAKLKRAEARQDLAATVEIFEEYLGKPAPPSPKPNIQPLPHNTGADIDPPAPLQNNRTWSRKEIGQFYVDKAAGRYRGKEEEANRLEQDIFLAQTDGLGRIVA